jgi:methylaspartate mutase sigma subunit
MAELITVVTGTIGIDIHSMGLRIIEHSLQKAGFKVVSLGVQVSQQEFIDAAREANSAAILVSSLGGHAALDCEGFRDKLKEAGLEKILLYIGGNLVVGKSEWLEVEKKFKQMGFDRVFPQTSMPSQIIADLIQDLKAKGIKTA